MNTTEPDAFTAAARKEAQLASLDRNGRIGGVGDLGAHMAEWARAHLAAQEPTDAEALVEDIIRWDDTVATDGPCDGTWDSLAEYLIALGWTKEAR